MGIVRVIRRLRGEFTAMPGLRELARREQLLERRERELNLLRERIARHAESNRFVAKSPAMQEVLELAGQVAPLDTTVLVVGESGTGKEFVVRMIHEQSRRAGGDELGEVAPTVQAKLLRALQQREIRRVGGERTIAVHTRVIAATHRDLRAAVEAGSFRQDLYFRLSAFVISIPPLRIAARTSR